MISPSGRLELTWTNKHLRLLADEAGGYTWVPPADYRVAEVRLLHDVVEIGQTLPDRRRASDNLLVRADVKMVGRFQAAEDYGRSPAHVEARVKSLPR